MKLIKFIDYLDFDHYQNLYYPHGLLRQIQHLPVYQHIEEVIFYDVMLELGDQFVGDDVLNFRGY